MVSVLLLGRAAHTDLTAALAAAGMPYDLVIAEDRQSMLAALAGADAVVTDWQGTLVLDAEAVAAGPQVRLVQYPGAGLHSIDVAAWRAAGAQVCHVPGANAGSVAEWAVLAAGALCRQLTDLDAAIRAGTWPPGSDIVDLSQRRVGVLGAGAIGAACLRLFAAFGCEVAYHARRARADLEYPWLPFDDLLTRADVLVVAVPLTPSTQGLIGAVELAALPPGALLINVGRGPVTDEVAVADALSGDRLGGAALDVFGTEPLPTGHRLRTSPRTLLSPHVAGGSGTARRRIFAAVAENLTRIAAGLPPCSPWPEAVPPDTPLTTVPRKDPR